MIDLVCKTMSIRDEIADQYPDIPLLFMTEEIFDDAIIGVIEGKAHEPAVAYDYDKVINANMRMGMSYEEAEEYFGYNQIDADMGEHTPVFITRIKQ